MIGDAFKGILFLAVIGFALIGGATILPDSAWEKIPPKLIPIRQYLAEKGIISDQFLAKSSQPGIVCSGGVCRLTNNDARNPVPSQEAATSVLPDVASEPVTNDISGNSGLLSSSLSSSKDVSPAPLDPENGPLLTSTADDPENLDFIPSSTPSDTLPDLQFDEKKPGKELAGSNLPASPRPLDEDPFPKNQPVSTPGIQPVSAETTSIPNTLPVNPDHLRASGRYEFEEKGENRPQNQASDDLLGDLGGSLDPSDPIGSSAPIEPSPQSATQPISQPVEMTCYPASIASSTPAEPVTPSRRSLHETIVEAVSLSERSDETGRSFLTLNSLLTKNDAEITDEDRALLHQGLDRLAFDVFYNPKTHILWKEYLPAPNETLSEIAARCQVTPELLAVINSLHQNPDAPLPAGQKLKVIEGPVSAEVSLSRMELLLKFNGLYGGRFKMGCAQRAENVRGEFAVTRKIMNPDYKGPSEDGQITHIAGGSPENPLGPCWIELAGGLGLQGTNHPEYVGQKTAAVGGLIFSNKDISHLNILLTKGSVVRVTD